MSKKAIFWAFVLTLFIINLAISYAQFLKLKEFEYKSLEAKLISSKELVGKDGGRYFSLLFKSGLFSFRTFSPHSKKADEGALFLITIRTKELSFLDMFKTPRVKTVELKKLAPPDGVKEAISRYISSQHEDSRAKEVYLNLFLNSDVSPQVDEFIYGYGLGAFFAISGLNVALLVGLIFLLLSEPLRFFQDRFFPYLDRNFLLLLFCTVFLFFYAYLTDFTPSFMRAVIASCLLFWFAIRGENLLSYKILSLTVLLCIAIFPSFLFSIGFWLSVYGVFLIYLFFDNWKFKNKALTYVALSSWLFVAMLPVTHYLFGIFTKAHLLNSLFSALFDIFYPVSFALHALNIGYLFDSPLIAAIESAANLQKSHFLTPIWFFYGYIALSLASAYYKKLIFAFNTAALSFFISAMIFVVYFDG